MENMTCDRKKKDDCIYDNMVIAGNNCIYGKRDSNNLEMNETIAYNINEIANLNDTDFKRYILNNAIDNSKGYLQI